MRKSGGETPTLKAADWIDGLGLEPHPEGGHYRETYRSKTTIGTCCLGERFDGGRPMSTAIYFLLAGEQVSRFHRLEADELWHHYHGSSLTIHRIDPGGGYRTLRLGSAGGRPQALVEAGCWFGATVDDPTSYALVGCTMAPGFDFRDFELGRRGELLRRHPGHRDIIERLTPPDPP